MKNRVVALIACFFAIALTGCATRTPMAFQDDAEKLNENSKPVYLMTATLKNTNNDGFQPKLIVVNVERGEAKESADRINFTIDDKAKNESNSVESGNSYLLRMQLDPGSYTIRGLTSMAQKFPIIGSFFAPLHSPLDVHDKGVFYLGHVDATVRERKGEEFKAGPSIPLIDQAVAGASGGTFDIEIVDNFVADAAAFRAKFPALANVEIKKAILPPFDRAKAQEWWETH